MLLTKNKYNLFLALMAFFGLLSLITLEAIFEPVKNINIKDIDKSLVLKKVELTGQAKNVFVSKNTLFFEISNNGKIKAVKFNPTQNDVLIVQENNYIKAIGTIQEYKNQLEIIVEEVTALD